MAGFDSFVSPLLLIYALRSLLGKMDTGFTARLEYVELLSGLRQS